VFLYLNVVVSKEHSVIYWVECIHCLVQLTTRRVLNQGGVCGKFNVSKAVRATRMGVVMCCHDAEMSKFPGDVWIST